MLVLTRKLQETIQIGDDVTITILKVKGRTVRLGIEAPRQVRVLRGELPPAPPANDRPISKPAVVRSAASQGRVVPRDTEADRWAARDRGCSVTVAAEARTQEHAPHRPLSALVPDRMGIQPMTAPVR